MPKRFPRFVNALLNGSESTISVKSQLRAKSRRQLSRGWTKPRLRAETEIRKWLSGYVSWIARARARSNAIPFLEIKISKAHRKSCNREKRRRKRERERFSFPSRSEFAWTPCATWFVVCRDLWILLDRCHGKCNVACCRRAVSRIRRSSMIRLSRTRLWTCLCVRVCDSVKFSRRHREQQRRRYLEDDDLPTGVRCRRPREVKLLI